MSEDNITELTADLRNMQAIEQIKAELQAEKLLFYMTTTQPERKEIASKKQKLKEKDALQLFSNKVIRKNYAVVIDTIRREKARDKSLIGIWSIPRFAKAHGNILCRPHGATEKKIIAEVFSDVHY